MEGEGSGQRTGPHGRTERADRRIDHSLITALRGVPDFSGLEDATLLKLLGASANLYWPEGRTVFEKGSPGEALYIVLSGEVAVVESGSDGRSEIARIGVGGYFGEQSLTLGEVHSKTVRTEADTELMVIPKGSFDALLVSDPELDDHFQRVFSERVAAYRP